MGSDTIPARADLWHPLRDGSPSWPRQSARDAGSKRGPTCGGREARGSHDLSPLGRSISGRRREQERRGATGIRSLNRLGLAVPFSAGVVVCPPTMASIGQEEPRREHGDCVVFLLLLWAGRAVVDSSSGCGEARRRLHFEPQSPFCKPRRRCRRRLGQCWGSDARQTPLREGKRPGLGVMVMFVRQDWHHENQERRRCAWRRGRRGEGRGGGGGGRGPRRLRIREAMGKLGDRRGREKGEQSCRVPDWNQGSRSTWLGSGCNPRKRGQQGCIKVGVDASPPGVVPWQEGPHDAVHHAVVGRVDSLAVLGAACCVLRAAAASCHPMHAITRTCLLAQLSCSHGRKDYCSGIRQAGVDGDALVEGSARRCAKRPE